MEPKKLPCARGVIEPPTTMPRPVVPIPVTSAKTEQQSSATLGQAGVMALSMHAYNAQVQAPGTTPSRRFHGGGGEDAHGDPQKNPPCMHPLMRKSSGGSPSTSSGGDTALTSSLDAADPTRQTSRKRQRSELSLLPSTANSSSSCVPSSCQSSTSARPATAISITNFKVEVHEPSTSVKSTPPPPPFDAASVVAPCSAAYNSHGSSSQRPVDETFPEPTQEQMRQSEATRVQILSQFLAKCLLSINSDHARVARIANNLVKNGFDSIATMGFITHQELHDCGLQDAMDQESVCQQAALSFDQSKYLAPPCVLDDGKLKPVRMWLVECGIPDPDAFFYAKRLFYLGYYNASELRHILHDKTSLRIFKVGHLRLFMHCIQSSSLLQDPRAPPSKEYDLSMATSTTSHPTLSGPEGPPPPPATPTLASLEQSYLDTLLQSTPLARQTKTINATATGSSAWVSSIQVGAPPPPAPTADPSTAPTGSIPKPNVQVSSFTRSLNQPLFMGPAATPCNDFYAQQHAVMPPHHQHQSQQPVTPQHMQLMYEAINQPHPNPCRRGDKIYWDVLTGGDMNDDRFNALQQYTPGQLQNAYLNHMNPSSSPNSPTKTSPQRVASELWTEENIALLRRAVSDPRCRHLSKVRWEVLANGGTGAPEYAPLASFTASQLRSRYRSLFGDKRPDRLRQRKQLQKQLQKQQEQQQQHQQHPDQDAS